MSAVGQDQTPASLMLKTGNNSTEPPPPRSLPPPAPPPPPPLHLPPVKAMPVRTAQIPRKSRKVIQAAAQEVLALHQGHLIVIAPKVVMLGSHQQQQTVPLKYHQIPAAVMEHPALLLKHQAHQGQQVPLLVIRPVAPVLEVHQDSLLVAQTQEIILE